MPGLAVVAWFALGSAVGAAYFAGIWWSAAQFARGGRVTMTIVLALIRLAVLGGLLTLASVQGAGPLLAMAVGIVLARFGVMRRVRRVAP